MDSPGQERELLAIVFTDAVDSSHRTASNEDHSITLLLADLDYIRSEAEVRGGTVLKNTGDGLLIAFKKCRRRRRMRFGPSERLQSPG